MAQTIQQALKEGSSILKSTSPTPELDAELLLLHALNCPTPHLSLRGGGTPTTKQSPEKEKKAQTTTTTKTRSHLFSHSSDPLPSSVNGIFLQHVKKRAEGKPIAYITKTKEFFGRPFYVDKRVLIPRPETEELCQLAIKDLKKRPDIKTIIDIGTGSGCIAITLANELENRQIIATDISKDALQVAEKNYSILCPFSLCHSDRSNEEEGTQQGDLEIKQHSTRIDFVKADLLKLKLFENSKFKIKNSPLAIIANLPYIGMETNNYVEPNVKAHEPSPALFSGKDGLDHYRRLSHQIKQLNLNIQFMALEISPGQESIIELFGKLKGHFQQDSANQTRFAVFTP